MTADLLDLSIVIPAFNEEERIAPTLEKILPYFKEKSLRFEVIVVDDGSCDRTAEIAVQKLGGVPYQILRNSANRGKGFSVRRGVLAASGSIILFTDADLSTPIDEFEKLNAALNDSYDVAIGSRSIETSNVEIHQNVIREVMGKTFNLLARLLSFYGVDDSQCGFKAFKREAAQTLFHRQRLSGFCFDAEILFLAQKMGYRIKEVGVRWRNAPKSKVRIIRDSLYMLFDLFRIRILHFGEKY
mgnify:CR=1 FL=1